ncbi:MAG: hypothetical protein PWP59_476, partial [Sphaerochaeta sp.]|nr:hypothetical protein [Sphaerochaeta sp.]
MWWCTFQDKNTLRERRGWGKSKKKGPAATYSPTVARSTIGVRVLNFRVRDGNGC